MKIKSVSAEISQISKQISSEIEHWEEMKDFGCSDPFWADGCNMNLTRNHIICYKKQIEEICVLNTLELPEEYYLPTPPEVDSWYMADLKSERAVKFKKHGEKIIHKKINYSKSQLVLF